MAGRKRRIQRARRGATAVVAVVGLIVSTIQSAEAKAHRYPSWSGFALPKTKSIAVHTVHGGAGTRHAKPLHTAAVRTPDWPAPQTASVTLDAGGKGATTVPDTPLHVAAAGVLTRGRLLPGRARSVSSSLAREPAPTGLGVQVVSQQRAHVLGIHGVVVGLSRHATSTAPTSASLSLDYSGFADAYGGDYAARLRLVQLPACALSTPAKAECRVETPVPASSNDLAHHTLVADTSIPGADPSASGDATPQVVLAAVSGPTSGGGDYRATSLQPSGSWSVGNTGAFTYSYPITVPPSVGGDAPDVTLSYDSASVDGRTSSTNAQASWIGDGWDYSPGYIERSYESCDDDGHANDYDQCWAGDNATLSMAGHSGRLIPTSSGGTHFRLQVDDGSSIDEISVSSSSAYYNGVNAGTYWRLTTNDGTQYFFGADHLPVSAGGTGTDVSTKGAWGVRVYGDDAGEPCHASTFDTSECIQGWRWNLDFVVDPDKNITVYHYTGEANYYGAGTTHTRSGYTRDGYLTSITYGQRVSDYTAKATPGAEIDFTVTGRCDGKSGFSCATAISASNASHFPDVPYDQNCASTGSCTNYAPTFWTTKALSKITTKIWDESLATPGWSTVDTYTLSAPAFPDPGDPDPNGEGGTAKPALWLNSISHVGSDTRGGGAATAALTTSFDGAPLPNRVFGLALNGVPPINRYRLTAITSETGATTTVNYDTADSCDRAQAPAEDDDTALCYPVRWTPPEYTDPMLDWFYTYPVIEVDENDNGDLWGPNQSPAHITHYAYAGPAWHRDDSEYTPDKTRTWDQFRGYRQVTTTTGASPDPITKTVTNYLQGMDGDHRKDGSQRSVTVTTATGTPITDANIWAGFAYQTSSYSAAGASLQDQAISIPWRSDPTATQTLTGLPDLIARYTGTSRVDHRQLLADGSWRTSRVTTSFEQGTGLPTAVDDLGQIDASGDPVGGTTPEKCTTTSYASDPARNMIDYPAQVITTAGACATTVTDHALAATKTLYGSSTLGAIASSNGGDPTSTQALRTANPVEWAAAATTGYDAYGRIISQADPMGRTTSTSYGTGTAAKYLPVGTKVTNNAGWTTTSTLDPGRQLPLATTDVNGRLTTETYDGLGRLTQVWLPNHAKTKYASTPSLKYAYQVGRSSYVAVTSSSLRDDNLYSVDIAIYDAFLQLRQHQTTPKNGAASARLITDIGYDSHGWTTINDQEFYNYGTNPSTTPVFTAPASIPAETVTSYDSRGRPVKSALWSTGSLQWQTTTSYPGADETDTTPPAGGVATRSITDARGQQVQLTQDPSGPLANTTYYSYDAAGRQTKIVGPLAPGASSTGSPLTWTSAYNALGQLVTATDPDTGTTTSSYDDDSELVQTRTTGNEPGATTRVLSYDHVSDPLGRVHAEYTGGTITSGYAVSGGTKIAAWGYDTATGGKGQLAAETEYAADGTTPTYTKTIVGYTTLGQPTGSTLTIPAGTYNNATAITYKDAYYYSPVLGSLDDDIITETGAGNLMPGSEDYGFSYDTTGLPVASGGTSAYETNTDYDPHGRLVRAVMGIMPDQVAETLSWDEPTGRLVNATFSKEDGSSPVDNITYTYNPAGEITSTTDTEGGGTSTSTDRQCYTYDSLDRLTQAWTDTGSTTSGSGVGALGACATSTPSAATVGGPAAYWQTYTYDLTGNRTTLVDHSTTGSADTTTSETYTGTSDAHAVHTVTTGDTTMTYSYDGGRPTSATNASDPTVSQTYTWAPQGNLASLTQGTPPAIAHSTSYSYDPDGDQIARTTDGTTTLQLGQDTITLDSGGAATQVIREYPFPGGPTAVRTATPNQGATADDALHYQYTDPHGTALTDITAQSLTVARQAYTPFGQDRSSGDSGGTFATNGQRGFLNAPLDTTNDFTLLGAREYQPSLGRFLSADSILEARMPQQFNGYAYANNNPMNLSDPDGTDPAPQGCTTTACYNCMYADDGCFGQSETRGSTFCDRYPSAMACGGDGSDPYTRAHAHDQTSPPPNSPVRARKSGPKLRREHHLVCDSSGSCYWELNIGTAYQGDGYISNGRETWSTQMSGGILKRLPTGGDFPFEPKKGQRLNNPGSISRKSGNPVDKYGDVWQWDPIKQEWDVEHADGSHTNIGPDGNITHKENNTGRAPKGEPGSEGSNSYSINLPSLSYGTRASLIDAGGLGIGILIFGILVPE